jgi:hypothetical protein
MPKVLKDSREVESHEDHRYGNFDADYAVLGVASTCAIAALVCFGFITIHFFGR